VKRPVDPSKFCEWGFAGVSQTLWINYTLGRMPGGCLLEKSGRTPGTVSTSVPLKRGYFCGFVLVDIAVRPETVDEEVPEHDDKDCHG
jgi:hypothetical protein